MGMFDSVYVRCPCGEELEFQSKAGDCSLHSYTLTDAPFEILGDVIGDSQTCGKCGRVTTIQGRAMAWPEYGEP